MKTERLYDIWSPIYEIAHHLQTLWADTKHRNLAVEYAHLPTKGRILDIGTGTALTAKIIAGKYPQTSTIGIDFSKKMLQKARKKTKGLEIKLVRANSEKLPFQNNTFDAIISAYGFGAIENPEKAMKEIVRVAKPNAIVSLAEMVEPIKYYPIKKLIHNYFVGPWIKFFWNFRDLNLFKLFEENNMGIVHHEYFFDRVLGSTAIISGPVKK